jgi:hypothetical protein
MKTILLLLFSQAFLTSVQAQTTPPSQFRLSEKFKVAPRSLGLVKRGEAIEPSRQQQQLAPGGSYRSHPHAMRIAVPDSGVSKMPQAAVQSKEGTGGIQQLPSQQYMPDQPAMKPERNSSRQDGHSGSKP